MRVHAAASILALLTLQGPAPGEPLALVRRVALPGVEGWIDHLAVDLRAERLFVVALGNNTVEVLDVFYDPQTKRLFVTGGDGFVDVFDVAAADRFPRIAHVATAAGARTSLCVADQKRLYVAVPHRGAQGAQIRISEAR